MEIIDRINNNKTSHLLLIEINLNKNWCGAIEKGKKIKRKRKRKAKANPLEAYS